MTLSFKRSKFNPLYIYFFVLLFFGLKFTKTQIIGPLYLHDFVIILYLIYILLKNPVVKFKFQTLFLFVIIALIYLLYSFLFYDLSTELKIVSLRQFMMYFYFIVAYLYYNIYIKDSDLSELISFLYKIGFISIILQVVYLLYLFITDKAFSLFDGYNYFTHAIIFGIINYGAYVLVFKKGVIKWLLFVIALFISTLLGHASLFLAVFMLLLLVLLIKVNLKGKLIALTIVFLSVWGLTFLPQFRDVNASWRLLFWGEMIDFIICKNYGILGEGYGKPYVSIEFALKIRDQIGGQGFLDKSRYLERWLSPPHNSFITIALHTGLFSLLLLLYPLKNIVKFFFVNGHNSIDKTKLYITILLFSYIVWVSFNVVLELPHSAMLFWLVFFIAIEYFNQNKNYNEISK